jgi:hypothetical protein
MTTGRPHKQKKYLVKNNRNRNRKTNMKTLIATILIIAGLNIAASAQTFGGSTTITGTTNAILQNNGTVTTNSVVVNFPAKLVLLTGITSTNETAVFSYGIIVEGGGISNLVLVASITNSFASGTNGGTWTTNIPDQNIRVQLVPYAQARIGSFTNQIYVP